MSKRKPTPPSPVVYTVKVGVDPIAVPLMAVLLTYDNGETEAGAGTPGTMTFPVKHPGWGAWLEVTAEGYHPQRIRGITPTSAGPSPIEPLPSSVTLIQQPMLTRLRVAGRHFVNAAGDRVTIKGATCFQSYDRFLRGDLDPAVFDDLQTLGFNCIRVFGMDSVIPQQIGRPPFRPQDFGDRYYDALPAFCAEAAAHGLYVLFTVFADTKLVMPTLWEQQDHFNGVVSMLRTSPNTLGSLVNEYTEHDNGVERDQFPRPQGVAFDAGSAGDDQAVTDPIWDWCPFHVRRSYPSHIKDCCVVDHPNYLQGHAVLLDEPDRYGEQGNMNPEQACLSAAASTESAAGFVLHTSDGVYAQPFRPNARACAQAVIRVLRCR